MLRRMRGALLLVVLTGCLDDPGSGPGGDDGPQPPSCSTPKVVKYKHDVAGMPAEGEEAVASYAFFNKLGSDPGYLSIGSISDPIARIEFSTLVANGSTVDARGYVKLAGLDVGNCATTTELPGKLTALPDDKGWTFVLSSLTADPYCGGAAVAGSFSGCLMPDP